MISEGLQVVLNNYNIKDQEKFDGDKIRDFFYNFIQENIYVSVKHLTWDFLHSLGYKVRSFHIQELRNVLSYCFTPHIKRSLKEGKIEKYRSFLYKVIK